MTSRSCAKPPTIVPDPTDTPMRGLTKKERRQITGRMGGSRLKQRIHKENTRERTLGGRIRWCPMRCFRGTLAGLFKLIGLWGRGYREFLSPVVRHNTIAVNNLDPRLHGLTLLHLSDLHLDLDTRLTAVIADTIRPLRYDLAVITGDFNNFTIHLGTTALTEMQALMPAFSAPVYGVLGNHDSVHDIPGLEALGVRMLVNEFTPIHHNGAVFILAGIDDPNIFATHDLDRALPRNPRPGTPVILLSHSPCIHRESAERGIDLVLCGHTHGGQICLPGGRPILPRNDRGAPHVRRGPWREGATQGYTSPGTGSCGIPIRLNCPPEVILHHLVPADPP